MIHNNECGCEHHGHHSQHGRGHHYGDCCSHGFGRRRFPTREEIISEMEEYLEELRAEIKGVEEHLAELKKEA